MQNVVSSPFLKGTSDLLLRQAWGPQAVKAAEGFLNLILPRKQS